MSSSDSIIQVMDVQKKYEGGFEALKGVNLDIKKGEIFALLGPNGAGKTTLISIICGLVNMSSGRVVVDGHDIVKNYRKSRELIGLVPQELTTEAFEKVINTVSFSRGLFGKKNHPEFIDQVLEDLSLTDKKNNRMMTLSGGMKRRVMIAKALSHEPSILFLDEPSAGVDVELRQGMWQMIRKLRDSGVTIILTTHYIEEAEQMADRIGVINKGQIVLVEETAKLMQSLGKKRISVDLLEPLKEVPEGLRSCGLIEQDNPRRLIFEYDSKNPNVSSLLKELVQNNIPIKDLNSRQSSLEEIFVELVNQA